MHIDMAAASTTPSSETLCRYFASNICRNGSSCPFSHDRNAKPDRTCRYYLAGRCVFGPACRYDHKRPPSDETRAAKNHYRAAENSNVGKVTAASLNAPSVKVDTRKELPGNVVAMNWNKIEVSEKNGSSSGGMQSTKMIINNHVFSADAAEFIPSWKIAAVDETNTHASGSLSALPLCPYFETGNCDKGDKCQFVHGDICDLCNVPCLHPADKEQRTQHRRECMDAHEAAMEEAFAEARSADKVCGICMENIRERNSRFGILEGCRHCFCLDCIRQWRRNQNDQFEKKTVRSCPECRTHSDFVIPATYWVEDQTDKNELIARFRQNTKQKQCKYVKGGRIDDCPFGNKCFYKHELPDGTIVEGESPRTLRRRRRPLISDLWSPSDSDSDDDFSRIAQRIISRAFSLV